MAVDMTAKAAPMGQTRSYPVAADMPEIQQDKRIQDGGSPADGVANPVVDALKVLTQFVLAAESKGLPQAAAMKAKLGEFIGAVSGGAGGPATPKAEGEAPAPEAPPVDEASEPAPEQTEENAVPGSEQMPEGAEPAMPGQPPMMPKKKMPMRRSSQPDQISPLV